jgi:hypothetical protein
MKMPVKILVGLLATVLLLSAIVHCQDEEEEDGFINEEDDTVPEVEEPKLAKVRVVK